MSFSWRAAAAIGVLVSAQTVTAQPQYDYYSNPDVAPARSNVGLPHVPEQSAGSVSYSNMLGNSVSTDATNKALGGAGDCGCAGAYDDCGCGKCFDGCNVCRPLWTVKAGIVYLNRANSRPSVLLEETITGEPILNADAYNFNWNPGLDISLIRNLGSGNRSFELRYFGVDGWRATEQFQTPAIWNFTTDPPLFGTGVATIDSVYTSRLYSVEANLRHHSSDRLTWLAGFRYLQIHENLFFDANFGGNDADVTLNTDNHLYGGQVGLDWRVYDRGGPFAIDSVFKAGIFGNSADNTFAVNQEIGPAFATGQQRGQVAFVGEIGVTGVYQWTDHIAFRGGYQVLWVEGIAVASDQMNSIDVLSENGLNSIGGIFYHGALVSVDLTW